MRRKDTPRRAVRPREQLAAETAEAVADFAALLEERERRLGGDLDAMPAADRDALFAGLPRFLRSAPGPTRRAAVLGRMDLARRKPPPRRPLPAPAKSAPGGRPRSLDFPDA